MSLKAKLEAVIYAAEEPVTLAQLAFLFTAEALEWKAQQEAAQAAQPAQNPDSLPGLPAPELQSAEFDSPALACAAEEPPQSAAEPASPTAEAPSNVAAEANSSPEPAASEALEPVTSEACEENPDDELESAASDPAAAARRQARQQDREVRAILRQILDELIAAYAADGRGVEIREIAGGYRMATKPEYHDAVRAFVKSLKPPLKLSMPALETLAVIAYKQPVTAPEVNEIRGVDSSAVFGSLLARKLITTAGRKPVIGRPILYKTTREFLLRFGLKDVSELPSMEEFEKLAASELEDVEPPTEEEIESFAGLETASEATLDFQAETDHGAAAAAHPDPTPGDPSPAPEPTATLESPAPAVQSGAVEVPSSNPSEAPPSVPE